MAKRYLVPTPPSLLIRPGQPFVHRDLSWLQFNSRVLTEARTSANPIIERLKFLAISSSNLDEFFMIRFPSVLTGKTVIRGKAMSANRSREIRLKILERAAATSAKQSETLDVLASELASYGIHLVRLGRSSKARKEQALEVYREKVLPLLPPPTRFSARELLHLKNLQMALVFAPEIFVPIPTEIPQAFVVQEKDRMNLFLLDDLLTFFGTDTYHIEGRPGLLRITRDADVTVDLEEEDPESVPDRVRSRLGARDRGAITRIQYSGATNAEFLGKLSRSLRMSEGQFIWSNNTLCLKGLWKAVSELPDRYHGNRRLCHEPPIPAFLKAFDEENLFKLIDRRDILLHHPYDSFDHFVRFIEKASEDPHVTSIQQTLYRTDAESPVIAALIRAAQNGKKVRVFIELRARFDELNNLRLSAELKKAGVKVVFGFGKLKLHAKVALIKRKIDGKEKLYSHLSTGNYNSQTARLYEDLSIITSSKVVGKDINHFFESIAKKKLPTEFETLVHAPTKLHRKLLSLIKKEITAAKEGKPARIVAKTNALVDEQVIDLLYDASQAGVRVDLIVRGACSLIPGVHGLSENIRVISVVDRFLEHSRIYYFKSSQELYLSSADWMPRNFFKRLEIAFPVLDKALFEFIEKLIIPCYFLDSVRAKELTQQGSWKKRAYRPRGEQAELFKKLMVSMKIDRLRTQFFFQTLAAHQYEGTPLSRSLD